VTPAEIRALYVETLAHAEFETGTYGEQLWEELPEATRARWREIATPHVDALDAAGLLPTEGGQIEILYRSRGTSGKGHPVLDRHHTAFSAREAVKVALQYAPHCERIAEFAIAAWQPLPDEDPEVPQ
jgi:hypothetical protein